MKKKLPGRKPTLFLVLALIFLSFSTNSCKKDTLILSDSDYLIFGHFYGECMGEGCVEIFRLEKDQLLEDTRDIYPNGTDFYQGDYTLLSQEKFQAVKELTDHFPQGLLEETEKVIGQPDAGDWGGLYIEYNSGGIRKFWLVDQMKSNLPVKYHDFIDQVNDKISLLQ